MSGPPPILDLDGAAPGDASAGLPAVPLDLRLRPGDCALIEVDDGETASGFADLCCGLAPLRNGRVRFLGHDWSGVADGRAAALRGRIGRTYGPGSWIGFLGVDLNILWPQLHHTRRPEPLLRAAAADLARGFGLPGLPLDRPDAMNRRDLLRADCVRAFIGEPRLVILDGTEVEQLNDIRTALLNALIRLLDRRGAAIYLTGETGGRGWPVPATLRLRLTGRGLVPLQVAA